MGTAMVIGVGTIEGPLFLHKGLGGGQDYSGVSLRV